MPIVSPVSPILSPRLSLRSDAQQAFSTQVPAAQPVPGTETGEEAVQPAAPPSAVQMQIKALITEQAQTLNQDPTSSEAPS